MTLRYTGFASVMGFGALAALHLSSAQAAECEQLKTLKLAHVEITAAQSSEAHDGRETRVTKCHAWSPSIVLLTKLYAPHGPKAQRLCDHRPKGEQGRRRRKTIEGG